MAQPFCLTKHTITRGGEGPRMMMSTTPDDVAFGNDVDYA